MESQRSLAREDSSGLAETGYRPGTPQRVNFSKCRKAAHHVARLAKAKKYLLVDGANGIQA